MMENLEFIKGVDIYLLDQCMKGNLTTDKRVLDAGFGKGRNLRFCFNQGVDIVGIDRNPAYITLLQEEFPEKSDRIIESSIENYTDSEGFDFIICNAVLHFAENHAHFDELMKSLVSLLRKDGILFIRMTSDIGISDKLDEGNNGVYIIPDGNPRYLITRAKVERILEEHKLKLAEPVKTVNVEDLRCMTTLVLRK